MKFTINFVILMSALLLSACSSDNMTINSGTNQISSDAVNTSASSEGISLDPLQTSEGELRVDYMNGSNQFINQSSIEIPRVMHHEDGVGLNFIDLDVNIILEAILKDVLNISYEVDQEVSGTLTLQTNSPVARGSLLFALEEALGFKNIALLKQGEKYLILPTNKAPNYVSGLSFNTDTSSPGFTVSVIPLKHTLPSEMQKILQPFTNTDGIIRADDNRQMIIFGGTSREKAAILRAIETFDVDWMKGMSFALYHVRYVESQTIADELLQIFSDANNPIAGMVRLIPIPRINAILGISANQSYLAEVEGWINRLDLGGETAGRQIYVYQVKHGRAVDIAQNIASILGTQGSANNTSNRPRRQPSQTTSPSFSNNQSSENTQSTTSNSSGGLGSFGQNRQTPSRRTNTVSQTTNVFESSGLKIVPNEENNSILILASPTEFGVIERALSQIDVPPKQVLIETSLAEVGLTDEFRYGIQWFLEGQDGNSTWSNASNGGVQSSFPGFSFVFSGNNSARAVLNTLASMTNINVLSSPKLMVLNNQTATIQVGDQVPVATQSAVSATTNDAPIVNTVQFKDTGVILTVTPRIGAGGVVMLDIEQEVSDVVETTSSGIDSPTIQQRKITTTVAVESGQTIALGGLIRETTSTGNSGIPFLKDIPLIGTVFKSETTVTRRTELVMLITPQIAQNMSETVEVLDFLKEKFQSPMILKNIPRLEK